jgi:hypothetical protein
MNSKVLVGRDAAVAALVAALPADFGADHDFGDEMAGDAMGDDMAGDFGDDFGDDFGAAHRHAANAAPGAAKTSAQKYAAARYRNRMAQLNPNYGSKLAVENYVFTLSAPILIGTGGAWQASANPATRFRPERVITNVAQPGFAYVSDIKTANVSGVVGNAQVDAWAFNPLATGVSLSLPTCDPGQVITALGTATNVVPTWSSQGATFVMTISMVGPSRMVG